MSKQSAANWYAYFVRCADGSLYGGITTDLTRRIKEHNHSNSLGAKYTRVRRPVSLAYAEHCDDRSAASKREYHLKKLSKKAKEQLVSTFVEIPSK